jgi:hypothetical protein
MEEQDLHQHMLLQQQLQIQQQIQHQQIRHQGFDIDLNDMAHLQQKNFPYVKNLSMCHSVGTLETESIGAASLGW